MSADTESSTDFKRIDPSKFLSDIIGSSVVVKLHNGVEYKGDLQTIDGYMNVVLENGEESVNGKVTRKYGDVFLRGNNVEYYSLGTGIYEEEVDHNSHLQR
ncbi:LSM6 [Candida pseudojiufengensis]|uniref:LSM6 n=1 Tax=Candida pseudojiufengensis TaxID=497109 RepID=UPI00222573FD|nr:LSM6 [Candida pseudojiufengensis]KAI5963465.1 LSM6 [Candida pseudojiufengensis]